MKMTVEISDALMADARKLAAQEGTTLRALVEAGLRRVIEESKTTKPFQLRDGSVSGQGMRPEVAAGGWDEMLRLIYEGRGG